MRLDELASLMGKTVEELKEELNHKDVIELKLTEKVDRGIKESGGIEILE